MLILHHREWYKPKIQTGSSPQIATRCFQIVCLPHTKWVRRNLRDITLHRYNMHMWCHWQWQGIMSLPVGNKDWKDLQYWGIRAKQGNQTNPILTNMSRGPLCRKACWEWLHLNWNQIAPDICKAKIFCPAGRIRLALPLPLIKKIQPHFRRVWDDESSFFFSLSL